MTLLLVARILGVLVALILAFFAGSLFWEFVYSDRFFRTLMNGSNAEYTGLIEQFRSEGGFERDAGEIDYSGRNQGDNYVQNIYLISKSLRATSRIFRASLIVSWLVACALSYWAGGIVGPALSTLAFLAPAAFGLGVEARNNRLRAFHLVLWNLAKLRKSDPVRGREFADATPFKRLYDAIESSSLR